MKTSDITQGQFDAVLGEILREHTGEQLLFIPGIYECVSEYFNNEVIDRIENQQEKIKP